MQMKVMTILLAWAVVRHERRRLIYNHEEPSLPATLFVMKILSRVVGSAFIWLLGCHLLTSCSCNHKGNAAGFSFLPGPVIAGGVAYYPAKPGATYHNTVPDYTTNPPPVGVVTFVTVFSTNGLVINLTDGKGMGGTNGNAVRFTSVKLEKREDVSGNSASPISGLY